MKTATVLTFAALALLFGSLAFGFRDAPSQTGLTWRQAEILVVRARTHACTDELGRYRFRVQDVIVRGGPPYRRWVLVLWRKRAAFYCDAARQLRDPRRAICYVFGSECAKAIRVATCESNLYVYARSRDGLYWGTFQQGAYSRARYGFGWTALAQARAAKRHRDAEGWGPWPLCGRL